jgi:SAM-dependent methyltransferase
MSQLTVRHQPEPNNLAYYWIGFAFLVLNKIRHSIRGYTSPRPFPITQIQRAIEYDFSIVTHWLDVFAEYTGNKADLAGKSILELGPGADLGIGLITLWKGARKYNAIDVHNLAESVPNKFYENLFHALENNPADGKVPVDYLRSQLKLTQSGKNDKLNYICRQDFDITIFQNEGIDLVFSQAAFEHFDDIDRAFSQLSRIVKQGAVLVAEIDLNTHTRWLRDVDPLNIYRYSDTIYNLFRFRGSPNRTRPFQYTETLEKYGWDNIRIIPLTKVEDKYLSTVTKRLDPRFWDQKNQIEFLSVMLCATKK